MQNNDQNVSVTADTTMEIIHAAGIINLALSEQNVRANLKARKSGGGLSSPVSLFGNQAAALGIGGSVVIHSIDNQTLATIEQGAEVFAGAFGELIVSATENVFSLDLAQAGGSSGRFGVSGSLAAVDFVSETVAHLESGVQIVAGSLSVIADSVVDQFTLTGAFQKAAQVGIGVGVGILDLRRQTAAIIGNRITDNDDSIGSGGTDIETGTLTLDADNRGSIWGVAITGAFASSTEEDQSQNQGGSGGGQSNSSSKLDLNLQVAGSVSIHDVLQETHAYINDGGVVKTGAVTDTSGGNAVVTAVDDSGVTITADDVTGVVVLAGAFTIGVELPSRRKNTQSSNSSKKKKRSSSSIGIAGSYVEDNVDITTEAFIRGTQVDPINSTLDESVSIEANTGVSVFVALGRCFGRGHHQQYAGQWQYRRHRRQHQRRTNVHRGGRRIDLGQQRRHRHAGLFGQRRSGDVRFADHRGHRFIRDPLAHPRRRRCRLNPGRHAGRRRHFVVRQCGGWIRRGLRDQLRITASRR